MYQCIMLILLLILLQSILIETAKTNKKDLVPYPDIFIIGQQKCGTTSLNKLLFEHPQICSEGVKEKHFYSERNYFTNEMIKEYLFQFSKCKKNQFTVDATPAYMSKPEAAERINSSYVTLSKKKFVILLREPVSRHYSEYQRNLRICFRAIDGDDELNRNTSTRTAEEKLARAQMRCHVTMRPHTTSLKKDNAYTFAEWTASPFGSQEIRRGRYLNDIKRWLTVVDRSQIFILNFQSVVSNTTDVMTRLSSFLNIGQNKLMNDPKNPEKIILPPPPPSNTYVDWEPSFMDCPTYEKLYKYFEKENEGLYDFLNNAPNRPKQEPIFPMFTSTRSKCIMPNYTSNSKSTVIKSKSDSNNIRIFI